MALRTNPDDERGRRTAKAAQGAGIALLLALMLATASGVQAQASGAWVRTALLHGAASGETDEPAPALKKRSQDAWLGADKAQHVGVSFLLTLGSQYTLVAKADLSERRALPVSVGVSAFGGLAKEVYDGTKEPPSRFSARDLAADAVGIALAVAWIAL